MTIELRGGLFVLDSALRLAIDLEARGHVLTAKDGALHVTNQSRLTAEDKAAIKAQRLHLMAITAYEVPT